MAGWKNGETGKRATALPLAMGCMWGWADSDGVLRAKGMEMWCLNELLHFS